MIDTSIPFVTWASLLNVGIAGFILFVLYLVIQAGALRTRFEIEARVERTKRAEDQVDKLLPVLEKIAQTQDEQTDSLERLTDEQRRTNTRLEVIERSIALRRP